MTSLLCCRSLSLLLLSVATRRRPFAVFMVFYRAGGTTSVLKKGRTRWLGRRVLADSTRQLNVDANAGDNS